MIILKTFNPLNISLGSIYLTAAVSIERYLTVCALYKKKSSLLLLFLILVLFMFYVERVERCCRLIVNCFDQPATGSGGSELYLCYVTCPHNGYS